MIHTAFRTPNANAYAERWVRTVREECLDRLFILSEGHLHRVLRAYVAYYNQACPHQGLQQQAPIPFPQTLTQGAIRGCDVLGGCLTLVGLETIATTMSLGPTITESGTTDAGINVTDSTSW